MRCNFCYMRFDTDRADARLNAEREAAEREAVERQAEEEDEEDDTLYGLPSARERRRRTRSELCSRRIAMNVMCCQMRYSGRHQKM